MGPYQHKIANLKFERVTGTSIDIFQSNFLVLLTSHTSLSLITIIENQKNTHFSKYNRNIPLAPINTKRLLLKSEF